VVVGGSVELDGLTHVDDVRDHLPALDLRLDVGGEGFETVAGYVLARLSRVPMVGDRVAVGEHELVVTEMDGLRVARVGVRPTRGEPVTG